MNNFSPDQMYDVMQARHEDIRNAQAARDLAKSVQDNQPSKLQTILSRVTDFSKNFRPQQPEPIQTIQLRNKEA